MCLPERQFVYTRENLFARGKICLHENVSSGGPIRTRSSTLLVLIDDSNDRGIGSLATVEVGVVLGCSRAELRDNQKRPDRRPSLTGQTVPLNVSRLSSFSLLFNQ